MLLICGGWKCVPPFAISSELLDWETDDDWRNVLVCAESQHCVLCLHCTQKERRKSLITVFLVIFRYCPWCSHQHWWPNCDGPHCYIGFWVGSGTDSHCCGDWAFYPHHYWCGRVPGCFLFYPVIDPRIHLARSCNISYRHHCCQCPWGSACYSDSKLP